MWSELWLNGAHTPSLHPQPRLKSRTQNLFLFPFQDSLATDVCRVRAGGAKALRVRFQGTSHHLISRLTLYLSDRKPLSRAWRLVRSQLVPAFKRGRSGGRHPGPMICWRRPGFSHPCSRGAGRAGEIKAPASLYLLCSLVCCSLWDSSSGEKA